VKRIAAGAPSHKVVQRLMLLWEARPRGDLRGRARTASRSYPGAAMLDHMARET